MFFILEDAMDIDISKKTEQERRNSQIASYDMFAQFEDFVSSSDVDSTTSAVKKALSIVENTSDEEDSPTPLPNPLNLDRSVLYTSNVSPVTPALKHSPTGNQVYNNSPNESNSSSSLSPSLWDDQHHLAVTATVRPYAQVDTLGDRSTPLNSPLQKSTTPIDNSLQKSTTQRDAPVQKSTTPRDAPLQKSTTPRESPLQKSTTPRDTPLQKFTTPRESPLQKSTTPRESPVLQKAYIVPRPTASPISQVITSKDAIVHQSTAASSLDEDECKSPPKEPLFQKKSPVYEPDVSDISVGNTHSETTDWGSKVGAMGETDVQIVIKSESNVASQKSSVAFNVPKCLPLPDKDSPNVVCTESPQSPIKTPPPLCSAQKTLPSHPSVNIPADKVVAEVSHSECTSISTLQDGLHDGQPSQPINGEGLCTQLPTPNADQSSPEMNHSTSTVQNMTSETEQASILEDTSPLTDSQRCSVYRISPELTEGRNPLKIVIKKVEKTRRADVGELLPPSPDGNFQGADGLLPGLPRVLYQPEHATRDNGRQAMNYEDGHFNFNSNVINNYIYGATLTFNSLLTLQAMVRKQVHAILPRLPVELIHYHLKF